MDPVDPEVSETRRVMPPSLCGNEGFTPRFPYNRDEMECIIWGVYSPLSLWMRNSETWIGWLGLKPPKKKWRCECEGKPRAICALDQEMGFSCLALAK